jgi:hypothetical protein
MRLENALNYAMKALVPEVGFEPTRPHERGIFLPLWFSPPTFVVCGLDFVFTLAPDFSQVVRATAVKSLHLPHDSWGLARRWVAFAGRSPNLTVFTQGAFPLGAPSIMKSPVATLSPFGLESRKGCR